MNARNARIRVAVLAVPFLLVVVAGSSGAAEREPNTLVVLLESSSGPAVRELSVGSRAAGDAKLAELRTKPEVIAASWSTTFSKLVDESPTSEPSASEVDSASTGEATSNAPTEDAVPSEIPSAPTEDATSMEPSEAPNSPETREKVDLDDPLRARQWALDVERAEESWTLASSAPLTAGAGVTVAVVDGGVDATAPDFVRVDGSSVVLDGYDAVNQREGSTDPDEHGTHVAGVLAAVPNNGTGVSGLAPGVSILPVDVFDEDGASLAATARGVIWAIEHGADIINPSLGSPKSYFGDGLESDVFDAALKMALERGVVVVAAAGNDGDGENELFFPASYPEVLSVAGAELSNPRDVDSLRVAPFSEHNAYVDLLAPGSCIVSVSSGEDSPGCPESPQGYASMDGTSMAAPQVSAVAAVAKSYWNSRGFELTGRTLSYHLRATSSDVGVQGRDNESGDGLVDLYAALSTTPEAPSAAAPVLSVPGDRTVRATDEEEGFWYAVVNYADEVSVTDGSETVGLTGAEDDPDYSGQNRLEPHCFPLSGMPFLVGSTEVYCSAVNAEGEVGAATFTVTVSGPGDSTKVPSGELSRAKTVPVPNVVHAG